MKYNLTQPQKIQIGKSEVKGRGVFAAEDLEEGEILEECHFIIPEKSKGGKDRELSRYMFACIHSKNKKKMQEATEQFHLYHLLDDEELKEEIIKNMGKLGYEKLEDLFSSACVLGYGMIYNHSKTPNVAYEFDYENLLFRYSASKNITKGKELFINYGNAEQRGDLT